MHAAAANYCAADGAGRLMCTAWGLSGSRAAPAPAGRRGLFAGRHGCARAAGWAQDSVESIRRLRRYGSGVGAGGRLHW